MRLMRTKDLVANVVFADEIAKKFLVDSGPVDSVAMSVMHSTCDSLRSPSLLLCPKMYIQAQGL